MRALDMQKIAKSLKLVSVSSTNETGPELLSSLLPNNLESIDNLIQWQDVENLLVATR